MSRRQMLGLAVLAAPPFAWLGVNGFINIGLPVLLNLRTERLEIRYDVAWTLTGEVVEVRGLAIRVQSPTERVEIAAERVRGHIAIRPLLDFRFEADELRADGARFAITTGPPPEDLGPPAPRPFRLVLRDVRIEDADEITIDEYTFAGDARVTGDLEYEERAYLEVPGAAIEIRDGVIVDRADPVVTAVKGTARLAIAATNPTGREALDILRDVDAAAQIEAQVRDLSVLQRYFAGASWFRLSGGAGPLSIRLRMAGGRLLEGTSFGARSDDIVAGLLSYRVTGDGEVAFAIAPDAEGVPEASMRLGFDDFAIHRGGDASPHVRGTGLRVDAKTHDLSLADAFETLRVAVSIPPSSIPDASVYNQYLPSEVGFALTGGEGQVRGDFTLTTAGNIARGDAWLTGTGIAAQLDDIAMTGKIALHANLREARLDNGKYDVSGSSLALMDVTLADGSGRRNGRDSSTGWWADFQLVEGHASVGRPIFLTGRLDAKVRDTVPIVTIFSNENPLPAWARGLLAVEDVEASARVELGETSFYVPEFTANGGPFDLEMELRKDAAGFRGVLLATVGQLALGLQLDDERSTVQVLSPRKWFVENRPVK